MSYEVRDAIVHENTHQHLIATWANLIFAIFKKETTLAGVQKVRQAYERSWRLNPNGLCTMMIVEPRAPMPGAEVRKALAEALAVGSGRTLMSAVIHEGSGFHASAVRSVVTGLAMLTRLPFPHQVFATVRDAANWMAKNPACGTDAVSILRVVQDTRLQVSQFAERNR